MVQRVRISPEGPELSRIVYGTWRILDDAATATPEHLARRLHACVDAGVTTIDTAEIYGLYEVEELLGRALAREPGLRNRIEIVTKCGIYIPCARHPERKVAFYNATADRLIRSTEKSLRLLGVDHVDVLLVHRPDWLTPADETARGLEELQRTGKIRHAGVSNYTPPQLELLTSRLSTLPCTNQVEISLFQMAALYDGTLDQLQRLRVHPMAWSPLGGGKLFKEDNEAAVRLRACMAELGAKLAGATPAQLAIAWVLAHPSAPVAVIGTNKLDRITELAGADRVVLAREDWYALWSAAQGRRIP